MLAVIALGSCAVADQRAGTSRVLAVVGATVVHPQRSAEEARWPDATIVVVNNRIVAVGPRQAIGVPREATVIDGRGLYVVPGLGDAHVHFFQSGNLYTRPDVADFNAWMPYAREVARNQARLPATFKVWIASGVTSVVDVGGPFWNFDVRDQAMKTEAAPRVAVAGPLISTVDDPPLDIGDPPIIKITSADDARALVRRELAKKPDYIKVWFIYRSDAALPGDEAIVRAAGDEAHAAGVPLAVHATQLPVAKAALRAGADFLVHSVDDAPVDDEFLQLAKSRNVLYCPTLFVHSGYRLALSNTWRPTSAERRLADPQIAAMMSDLDRIPRDILPQRVARILAMPGPDIPPVIAMRNLKAVHDAGITVVMGTDAGNIGTLHGPSVFHEMALMQQSGLTPLEVLRTATVNGAKAARRPNDIGVIAPGRLADFLLVDADPTVDVDNLSHVVRVVKDGRVFEPEVLIRSIR
jgi:imidazolonepropionase-like amidohydrolase